MTDEFVLEMPELALVILIGVSSSGKSSFAARHFAPTEIVSSDACRGMVDDDTNAMEATSDAFDLLHYLVGKRLKRGRLTVVDATNVQAEDRRKLVALAREWHCLPVAIVLDLPRPLLEGRHQQRVDRDFGLYVLQRQQSSLRRGLRGLKREGFRVIHKLTSEEAINAVRIVRQPLWNNRKTLHGPFDIIGDVHGCLTELEQLLSQLGYVRTDAYQHPEGRMAIFLGDLVDRGPQSLAVLDLVIAMVELGHALSVPGNHDIKFSKWLRGRQVQVRHGLEQTVAEVQALTEAERATREKRWQAFIGQLVSHLVLDEGKLVVAHAGMKEAYQGRGSGRVRDFALYGDTEGEIDAYGLPVRHDWAAEYRGRATVVYGHTPVIEPEWINRTICIDTGCVFGGQLTAFRYPERELVSVPAEKVYAKPVRPLKSTPTDVLSAQQTYDDLLDLEDVYGKRHIQTRLRRSITVASENAIAALEVMSRFAVHPKWLVYLPPTMSPCATHPDGDYLEHPAEAFAYYRHAGITQVLCEEKHMGSRAVVVVCRHAEVAQHRFGVTTGEQGIIVSRTGRRFFDDNATENTLLSRLDIACEAGGLYQLLESDFLIFDCELMPWSAKAQALLQQQYAAVGATAEVACIMGKAVLSQAVARGLPVEALQTRNDTHKLDIVAFRNAYRRYCWPVNCIDDYKLAPFHLLASQSGVHVNRDHRWHMDTLARLAKYDPLFMATPYCIVAVNDEASIQQGIEWWLTLTHQGGEGMVVKPIDFIAQGQKGLVQPAVKCRGREYLRIIYGPTYTEPENLQRLRKRGLGRKQSLAMREFILGIEALERFTAGEPLRRVHECVFGIMALESEPIDPRL